MAWRMHAPRLMRDASILYAELGRLLTDFQERYPEDWEERIFTCMEQIGPSRAAEAHPMLEAFPEQDPGPSRRH